ncbi:hypothetical protein BC828DRAFT_421097 [Blastocladiella britannica]|nr:hypothetical protein BC828DRAFT_421097 [Blastocladiella britannica]
MAYSPGHDGGNGSLSRQEPVPAALQQPHHCYCRDPCQGAEHRPRPASDPGAVCGGVPNGSPCHWYRVGRGVGPSDTAQQVQGGSAVRGSLRPGAVAPGPGARVGPRWNLLVRIVEGTVSPAPLATFYRHHHYVEVGVWDMLAAYAAVTFEKGSGIQTIELCSDCVLMLSVSELGSRSNTATTTGASAVLHSSVPLPHPGALGQKTSGGHYPVCNHGCQQQNVGHSHDCKHCDHSSFPSGPTSVIGGVMTAGEMLTTSKYCLVLDGIKHCGVSHIGIARCQSINNVDTIMHQLKKAAATLVHTSSLTRNTGTITERLSWVDDDPDRAAQAVRKIIVDMATSSGNCEDATMARVLHAVMSDLGNVEILVTKMTCSSDLGWFARMWRHPLFEPLLGLVMVEQPGSGQ